MNVHISAYVSMEQGKEEQLRELVADFGDALVARGYGNDPDDESTGVESMITVKQYPDYLEDPEGFLRDQLDGCFLIVLPTDKEEGEVDASEITTA